MRVYYFNIYFKELAHAIVEADKSRICRSGWQARNSRESRY